MFVLYLMWILGWCVVAPLWASVTSGVAWVLWVMLAFLREKPSKDKPADMYDTVMFFAFLSLWAVFLFMQPIGWCMGG